MRRLLVVLLTVLAVVAAAACSDDESGVDAGPGGEPTGAEVEAEVLYVGAGSPSAPAEVGVRTVADVEGFADRYLDDDDAPAVAEADHDGRTLVAGVVARGCFLAGGVEVRRGDDGLEMVATDLHPEEGEVDCAQAVVTVALVAVAADEAPPAPPADAVRSTVLRLQPGASDEAPSVQGPGVARTRAEGAALLGRFGFDPDDDTVLSHLDDGTEVVVAAVEGDSCAAPVDAAVVPAATTGLDVVAVAPPTEPGLFCEAFATAAIVLVLDADDVPVGTVVEGRADDLPTGVGVVQAVEPVDVDAGPVAEVLTAATLAAIPGAPDLDLPAPEDGAERLAFVVPACAAVAAELVADVGSGTVTASAHQDEVPDVDCGAETSYLVVADLDAELAGQLDPVA